jgi:hypothetical protein
VYQDNQKLPVQTIWESTPASNQTPLNLIEWNLIITPVIKSGRAKAVTAYFGTDSGILGAPVSVSMNEDQRQPPPRR